MTSRTISRKNFIKIVAAVGGAGAVIKAGYDHSLRRQTISQSRFLMGTLINITLIGGSETGARDAVASSLVQMASLEKVFSRYQNDSQLNQLNRQGYLDFPDRSLVELLELSNWISEITAGGFDVTIGPLVESYQQKYAESKLPTENEIQGLLPLINYQKLSIKADKISFEDKGMKISLDGIAKGYIVDSGVNTLSERGYTNLMVEAGGDLTALGDNNDHPWQLGVQSPRGSLGELTGKFSIRDRSAATSGDYFQSFSNDLSAHHILNPRTGVSSPELASVTVTAPSGAIADGLATGLMVLGAVQSLALVESLPGVEAFLIDKKLSEQHTDGFPVIS